LSRTRATIFTIVFSRVLCEKLSRPLNESFVVSIGSEIIVFRPLGPSSYSPDEKTGSTVAHERAPRFKTDLLDTLFRRRRRPTCVGGGSCSSLHGRRRVLFSPPVNVVRDRDRLNDTAFYCCCSFVFLQKGLVHNAIKKLVTENYCKFDSENR